jgi:hypothetical protein
MEYTFGCYQCEKNHNTGEFAVLLNTGGAMAWCCSAQCQDQTGLPKVAP